MTPRALICFIYTPLLSFAFLCSHLPYSTPLLSTAFLALICLPLVVLTCLPLLTSALFTLPSLALICQIYTPLLLSAFSCSYLPYIYNPVILYVSPCSHLLMYTLSLALICVTDFLALICPILLICSHLSYSHCRTRVQSFALIYLPWILSALFTVLCSYLPSIYSHLLSIACPSSHFLSPTSIS